MDAQKDVLKAARTLDQKVVQRARDATNAATATPKVVLKASARNARWVRAASSANRASHVSRVVTAATSRVLMSAWTRALKAGQKVSHARSRVQSPAVAAVTGLKAAANVASHALKPANPAVNALSVTLSSRTRHWPTRPPWLPQ